MEDDRAARFVERFSEGWSKDSDEEFFAVWREVLHPEVRLIQPMSPPTVGFASFEREFRQIRSWIGGLKAEVHDWASRGDLLFIEFTLSGRLGGEDVAWRVVDRFFLDAEGRCVERYAFFDPTTLGKAIVRHPSLWMEGLKRMRSGGTAPE